MEKIYIACICFQMKKNNKRIVILGSNSFIAKSLIKILINKQINYIGINRKEVNFENKKSVQKLNKIIKPNDVIIFIAAIAPVKNITMLSKNLNICENIINILRLKKFDHLIYVSSDAVYSDSKSKITEKSLTIPDSLHGFMHLIREKMLLDLNCTKTFVRPTLIYGLDDPHNGYGPNKFIRLAQNNKKISLFGNGEEKRDHINVENVAEIIFYSSKIKYNGIVNAVSGNVVSFNQIVKEIRNNYKNIKIKKIKRSGPMPHNGYRAFNNSKIKKKFPKLKLINLLSWIKKKYKYEKIN